MTENSSQLNGLALQKKWLRTADKRIIGQYLQKFIQYNSNEFAFLGVQPFILGTDSNTSLAFRTSSYIGSIPLRSSDTGKQIGDFVVVPRFIGKHRFEDYIEILNLLGTEISPEVVDSLPLASGRNFRPPLYLEAVKFIQALELLISRPWRKFDNVKDVSQQPVGQVDWNKYAHSEFKVENKLRFPVRRNVLSEFHSGYAEIRYVFDLCKLELLSSGTPPRISNGFKPRIAFIDEKLYLHKPKATNQLIVKSADSRFVRECKVQGNKILSHKLVESTAWRVDFSDVFEKFVQYIFKETAKETGGKLFQNFKFHSRSTKYYGWGLSHIEPDAIYQKGDALVFIDAKYKSNLYNRFEASEKLKEDHRHDLHQIMAYSSFSDASLKYGFLCYPSNEVEIKPIQYRNGINDAIMTVFVLGVPLKKDSISDVKRILAEELSRIGR